MTFRELCAKEVVQTQEGACLGRVDDLVFDPQSARIESLLLFGRPRLFGLLGREETLTIQWQEIEKIGTDALLVRTPLPEQEPESAAEQAGTARSGGGFMQRLRAFFK